MTQSIKILFFAALADKLDCQNEVLELPSSITSVKQLRAALTQRGGDWLALDDSSIRCAVNQDIVSMEQTIVAGDEIAFFPPVTGG